ncbi:serine hydrolase domain-containing protein [Novosphingobium malaysiense]|uniref:Beta-lactamase-related domain-containing protein n=1 Tax=Novosphingobium malaysiense TaxID=1348853 RepID=A0A0B1ZKM1_9SPHN|nr:serine hydrolase domain-containing protein [Novosphingobium malaysiense]KHK89845.1 hypothetical protein LK12_18195 [Novosphingobium malaysiense]
MINRRTPLFAGVACSLLALLPGCTASEGVPPVAAASQTAAAKPSTNDPQLRADVEKAVAEGKIPGAIAIIAKDGKIVSRARYGYANVATRKPLAEDTLFRLYSMSKPITSVVVMKLAERGLLDIDAPVSRYLPELKDMRVYVSGDVDHMKTKPAEHEITTAELLSHSSGIVYHFTGNTPVHQYYRKHGVLRDTPVGRLPGDGEPAHSLEQLVTRIGKAPLLFEPGERFHYSYSTTVLGLLVQRITGKRLDEALADELFLPLGMTDTGFFVEDQDLSRFPVLYKFTESGLEPVETPQDSDYRDHDRLLDGGGALVSTAADYLRFAEMLANGGSLDGVRILSPQSIKRMFTPRVPMGRFSPYPMEFGLGFAIGTPETEKNDLIPAGSYSWSGSGNTYFFVNPQHNSVGLFMTSVLGNSEQAPTWTIHRIMAAAAHRDGAL